MGIRNRSKLFTFNLMYGLYGKPSSKGELTTALEKTRLFDRHVPTEA